MSLNAWLAFCAFEVVLCLMPGPAVLYVVATALVSGARAGVAGIGGIIAGNIIYFGLSATGISAVIMASAQLFRWLQWAGTAYLLWLGITMLATPHQTLAGGPTATAPATARRAFLRGLIVQLANPKAIVFFVALLPQFIDPRAPIALQILILGATSVAIEFVVQSMYVLLASQARNPASRRWSRLIERIGGVCLLAAGLRMALLGARAT